MAANLAKALDGEAIAKVMSTEGPIVECVLIPESGEAKEIKVDMTPKKDQCATLLGGKVTFLGQYPEIDTVVMVRRDQQQGEQNKCVLPSPFDRKMATGAILLCRMDESSEPVPLPLEEWRAFAEERKKNPLPEDRYHDDDEDDEEEEEEEEEAEDDGDEAAAEEAGEDEEAEFVDDDEDDEDEDFFVAVLDVVAADFEEAQGRAPTQEELQEIMEKYNDPQDDETERELESISERARALCKAQAAYNAETGDGDEEEDEKGDGKDEEARSSSSSSSSSSAAAAAGGDGDHDGDNNDDEEEEEEATSPEGAALAEMIKKQLVTIFKKQQGREPTPEEVDALLQELAGDTDLHASLLGDEGEEEEEEEEEEEQQEEEGEEEERGAAAGRKRKAAGGKAKKQAAAAAAGGASKSKRAKRGKKKA